MDLTSLLLATGATVGLLGLVVLGLAAVVLGLADLTDHDLAGER